MAGTRREFLWTAMGAAAGVTQVVAAAEQGGAPGTVAVPAQAVPVLAEADVLVCGGGPSGIAAACCAARHGAKVVLLERWPSVGGMATNALVHIWHTSDRTKQVIFGIVQEAIERGGSFVRRRGSFPHQFETHEFDPAGMRVVFHQMLQDAGVRTFCNLTAMESLTEGNRFRGVLVDTKTGRKAVLAKIVLDATGDGDVAANAGVPFDFGRSEDGRVQGMTMIFCARDIDQDARKAAPADEAERVCGRMREGRDRGEFPPFAEMAALSFLRGGRDHVPVNMCPVAGNPLDEEELTRLSAQARQQVYRHLELWRREMPGFANAQIEQMGFGLGVRESRRIRGLKTFDAAMVVEARKQPDALGHGFWAIDIHDPKGGGYTTYSDPKVVTPPKGDSYHIPLGMCLNRQFANLAVVGRCASSTHEGHASIRLQSHGMVMGQGVGTCAALALEAGVDMHAVDLPKLQAALRKDGVYLEDVPTA